MLSAVTCNIIFISETQPKELSMHAFFDKPFLSYFFLPAKTKSTPNSKSWKRDHDILIISYIIVHCFLIISQQIFSLFSDYGLNPIKPTRQSD